MKNGPKIQQALCELLCQSEHEDTFVVVEHAPTKKFVQFIGSVQRPLMLDLPWQTLSELEFYRAVDFFKQWGIAAEEHPVYDAQCGSPVGEQATFQMTFDTAESAATVALAVFETVYGFSDNCQINIWRGWQV